MSLQVLRRIALSQQQSSRCIRSPAGVFSRISSCQVDCRRQSSFSGRDACVYVNAGVICSSSSSCQVDCQHRGSFSGRDSSGHVNGGVVLSSTKDWRPARSKSKTEDSRSLGRCWLTLLTKRPTLLRISPALLTQSVNLQRASLSSVDTWNSTRHYHAAFSDGEPDEFEGMVWGKEGSASKGSSFPPPTKRVPPPPKDDSDSEGIGQVVFEEEPPRRRRTSSPSSLKEPAKKSGRPAATKSGSSKRNREIVVEENTSDWEDSKFNLDDYAPLRRAARVQRGWHGLTPDDLVERKKTRKLPGDDAAGSDSDAIKGNQKSRKAQTRRKFISDSHSEASDILHKASKSTTLEEELDFFDESDSESLSENIRTKRASSSDDEKYSEEDLSEDEVEKSSALPSENVESSSSHLTKTRFDSFKISPLSIKALHTVLKYERMTTVQEATFPVILKGQDVLAKARTGTGKTIAFLLPAIEVILRESSGGKHRNPINVLIVCPTRELAQQAAAEARTLLKFHSGLGAQVVFGGTPIRKEQTELSRHPCQILVGTPGRLVDHITRTPDFARQLKCVKLFVLDEADHMLDMGFRESLKKIMQALPSHRQTLLFSATIPKEVHSMAKVALKDGHVFIDTVGRDSQDTHAKVKQQCILAPLGKQLGVVYSALKEHMAAEPQYKVLVFCTTARSTGFMAQLFRFLGFNSREIHSKKDQSYRTRISDEFRHSKGGIILFTSDVSARGVDYPNVTLVIQVGIPTETEQYIHRLGRTGRAGKSGEGLLILAPWESFFLDKLKNLPIQQLAIPQLSSQLEEKIHITASQLDTKIREQAYTAWIGYYQSLKGIAIDKEKLIKYANEFSAAMGFPRPPALSRILVSKLNLTGVSGIRIGR